MKDEYQRVYAEVNLDYVRENFEHIEKNLKPGTKVIGVLKTDGYGHGAIPIARELENRDSVFGFALATAEEAVIMRNSGIHKPLLILGYTFPYSYEKLILHDIRMTVFREDTLEELAQTCRRLSTAHDKKKAKVHIKVDTGMGRIGVSPDEQGLAFVKRALSYEEIEVEGIFTHFARADETDKTATIKQLQLFQNFVEHAEQESGVCIPIKHCSNSAGIIEMPEANFNVVRAGIILYGLWPSEEVHKNIVPLKPILSLYSRIVYVKEVPEGTPISYGGIFVAPRKMRIATVPVGYGEGYPRGLSNKGSVLVHGHRVPVLGRVCMDQFMIDVTDLPEVKEGDLVTLIGVDGKEQITIEELGELSGRFNYELACDLGKRIPRVYTKGGKVLYTKDYYQDF